MRKVKEENGFNEENEVQKDTNLNWWPITDVDKVSSSQEEYVDNQFLDVKDIDHSDLDNCKTNESEEERKRVANDAYNKYFFKSNVMIEKIALNVYNNQVEKQKEQESRFQQRRKKGDAMVELTLIEVIYNTCGKFYQVVNTKNLSTAVQYYYILFGDKIKIHQRKFPHLTLDVLLDDEHNFMTKLKDDTGNALHPLRFEEILGVVDRYDPISGLNEYQVFHPLSSLHILKSLNNIKLVSCFSEIENLKHSDFIRNSKAQLIQLATDYSTSTHTVSLTSFEDDNNAL